MAVNTRLRECQASIEMSAYLSDRNCPLLINYRGHRREAARGKWRPAFWFSTFPSASRRGCEVVESRRLLARFPRGCGTVESRLLHSHRFPYPGIGRSGADETASCFSSIFFDVRHFDVINDMMCCCPGRQELPGFFTKGERNEGTHSTSRRCSSV